MLKGVVVAVVNWPTEADDPLVAAVAVFVSEHRTR